MEAKVAVPSEALQKIAEFCNKYLVCDEEAKAYLNKRDISLKSIENFNIGAWPKNSFVIRKNLGDSLLREARVLWDDNVSGEEVVKFKHHRIVMPMYDSNGKCVSIMGRTIYNSDKQTELGLAKYINTGYQKRKHLFGLNLAKDSIRQTNRVLVTEGNLDVIKAHQNSIFNVVCSTGSIFTLEQMILLSRYTDNIYLGFDNDAAGDVATTKALLMARSGIRLKEKRVPKEFKDLDEYLMSKNATGLSGSLKLIK